MQNGFAMTSHFAFKKANCQTWKLAVFTACTREQFCFEVERGGRTGWRGISNYATVNCMLWL